MKLLSIIRDGDLGLSTEPPSVFDIRKAARAIVIDAQGKIALLHNTKHQYHKLPGGGVEEGENLIEALRREAREEIGCEIDNIHELAIVEECRNGLGIHQISHCFIAKVQGDKKAPDFTPEETADGFEIVWLPLDEAIKTVEAEKEVEDYEGKFINARELLFLKEAKSVIAS